MNLKRLYEEGGYLEKQKLLEKLEKGPTKSDDHVTMIMQEIWFVNLEDKQIAFSAWEWYKNGNLKRAFEAKKYEKLIHNCCIGGIQKISNIKVKKILPT